MTTTRDCSECGQSKSIQGIWYLRANRASGPFVCESCFRRPTSPFAASAPRMHAWGTTLRARNARPVRAWEGEPPAAQAEAAASVGPSNEFGASMP